MNTASPKIPLALLLSVGIATLLITGCGGGGISETDKDRGKSSTTTTDSGSSTSASPATDLAVKHALEQSTPRPPDVSAQFEFVGGAGPGPCLSVHSPPAIHVYAQPFASIPANASATAEANRLTSVSFGQAVNICINGFGLGSAEVEVKGPRGFRQVGTLRSHLAVECPRGDCDGGWDWIPAIDESWPVGQYQILARSSRLQVSTSFRLVSSPAPGIRVLGPSTDSGHNEVAADDQARVFLTGFSSMKSIRLVVYRLSGTGSNAAFFSVANIPLSSAGRAIATIPTGEPAPNTTYFLTTKYGGVFYFAPATIIRPDAGRSDAGRSVIVGPLPAN
jgi:hypothetical protein